MTNQTNSKAVVTLGTLESGKPYTVDLGNNSNIALIGGTGTGKTWLTHHLLDSLVNSTNPEDLDIILCDGKEHTLLYKRLCNKLHVKGYHTDPTTFIPVLEDVQKEQVRRVEEFAKEGVTTWEEYTNKTKDASLPLLVVAIEDVTSVKGAVTEDEYTTFKNILENISSGNQHTGIILLLVGHRSTEGSYPKGYLDNATLKLGLKMTVISEYEKLFGKELEKQKVRIPENIAEASVTSSECPEAVSIKLNGKGYEDLE